MKLERDVKGLTAIVLLILIVIIAGSVWFVNLLTQQRIFGFLLSAELVAFSMLVYIYMQETKVKNYWVVTGFVIIGVLIIAGFVHGSPALTPNVNITLYASEVPNTTKFGFGLNANNITSPGPTLTFKVNDIVNITVIDVGKMPHNWAIVSTNKSNAAVLFKAQVASGQNPLSPGARDQDIFSINQAGNFYYICQVPGHIALGMWGRVIVNSQ